MNAKKPSTRKRIFFGICSVILANIIVWTTIIYFEIDAWSTDIQDKYQFQFLIGEVNKILSQQDSKIKSDIRDYLNRRCDGEKTLYVQVYLDSEKIFHCTASIYKETVQFQSNSSLPLDHIHQAMKFMSNGVLYFVLSNKSALREPRSNTSYVYVEVGLLAADLYAGVAGRVLSGILSIFGVSLLMAFSVSQFSKRKSENLDANLLPTALPEYILKAQEVEEKQILELIGGRLILYRHRHLIEINDQTIHLTPKEYSLLAVLAAVPGHIYSEEEIIAALWSQISADSPRTSKDVKQQIFLLRKKLNDDANVPSFIGTERSLGYKLLIKN